MLDKTSIKHADLPPDIVQAIEAIHELACEAYDRLKEKYNVSFQFRAEPFPQSSSSLRIVVNLPAERALGFDFEHSLEALVVLSEDK